MKLPFLKNSKWPRIAAPREEKLINGSESDHLEDHCIGEMWSAIEAKDVKGLRSAMEALVLNMFDDEEG